MGARWRVQWAWGAAHRHSRQNRALSAWRRLRLFTVWARAAAAPADEEVGVEHGTAGAPRRQQQQQRARHRKERLRDAAVARGGGGADGGEAKGGGGDLCRGGEQHALDEGKSRRQEQRREMGEAVRGCIQAERRWSGRKEGCLPGRLKPRPPSPGENPPRSSRPAAPASLQGPCTAAPRRRCRRPRCPRPRQPPQPAPAAPRTAAPRHSTERPRRTRWPAARPSRRPPRRGTARPGRQRAPCGRGRARAKGFRV